MDVVSRCPLPALGFVWLSRAGTSAETVIVKATFVLRPGLSALSPSQDAVNEYDNHWNDDRSRSVFAPSDRVPFKPEADVMLVGHAFAPGAKPARSVMARLTVGPLDKSVEAFCDRKLRQQDGQMLEGPALAKMPLRWERAAGGPETDNPVGMRFDGPPDMYGMLAVPNLQPPGVFVSHPTDRFASVCFAPIAAGWPSRLRSLGRLASVFPAPGWESQPLPEDLDYAYFQSAPADQRVPEIRANERLVLENLHPDHPRLVTSLPGLKPRAVVERATGEVEEVALVADTLWIDTDRGICTVVWRGRIGLRHPSEVGRITVTIEGGAGASEEIEELSLDEVSEPHADDAAAMTLVPLSEPNAGPGRTMPFASTDGPIPPSTATPGATAFNPGGLDELRAMEPPPAPSNSATETIFLSSVPQDISGTPPFAPLPPTAPPPAPLPPPMVPPPPMMSRLGGGEPIAPAMSTSPWSGGKRDIPAPPPGSFDLPKPVEALPPKATPPADTTPAVVDEGAAKRGWKPVGASSGNGSKGPALVVNAVLGGAAAASDAALAAGAKKDGSEAIRKVAATPLLAPPKAVIELLWYEAAAMPRIRKQAGWKEVFGQIKGKAFEDELSGDSPPEKRQEARDRRDVAGLLARGEVTDLMALEDALESAVTEDGTLVPPLVLLAGDLDFPFDEVETLKATMAALSPIATGDKALKDALATADELLKTPWSKGAGGIAEGLTNKLKEVFSQGNRMLPARYVEGHTERMLLEQRAYQKRTVLGKVYIRSLLFAGRGGSGKGSGFPVYLPESLSQELPSFQRFSVRMIGEVRGKVDQYEAQEVAVRGVALGRTGRGGRV
ncbi:MAG: DUF2169 domain-containing protein [Byssovorax sp.]